MSTADEINLKTRAAWPVGKFARALNEQTDNKGKTRPLARRRGPRGRRLALKARREGWLPRVFGVDWGSPVGDYPALVVRQGSQVLFAALVDKTIFEV